MLPSVTVRHNSRRTFTDLYSWRGVLHLRVHGKGGKVRYLPLHPGTAELVTDYLEAARHGEDLAGTLFRPVKNNTGGHWPEDAVPLQRPGSLCRSIITFSVGWGSWWATGRLSTSPQAPTTPSTGSQLPTNCREEPPLFFGSLCGVRSLRIAPKVLHFGIGKNKDII
jgi:hypothetical protein